MKNNTRNKTTSKYVYKRELKPENREKIFFVNNVRCTSENQESYT